MTHTRACYLAPDIKLRKRHQRSSAIGTGSLALEHKDVGTHISGGRDLSMIYEGGHLREAKRDAVVSTNMASGFSVEEATATLLNKATNPTTASSRTGEEDIVVSLGEGRSSGSIVVGILFL